MNRSIFPIVMITTFVVISNICRAQNRIAGTVYDYSTNKVIDQVQITVSGQASTNPTDSQGKYVVDFDKYFKGNVTIFFSKKGYNTYSKLQTVPVSTSVDITLVPLKKTRAVHIKEEGKPFDNVKPNVNSVKKDAFDYYFTELKRGNDSERYTALQVFLTGKETSLRLIPVLIDIIQNGSEDVKYKAFDLLLCYKTLPSSAVNPTIIWLRNLANPKLQKYAAQLLSKFSTLPPGGYNALKIALKDTSSILRIYAMRSLLKYNNHYEPVFADIINLCYHEKLYATFADSTIIKFASQHEELNNVVANNFFIASPSVISAFKKPDSILQAITFKAFNQYRSYDVGSRYTVFTTFYATKNDLSTIVKIYSNRNINDFLKSKVALLAASDPSKIKEAFLEDPLHKSWLLDILANIDPNEIDEVIGIIDETIISDPETYDSEMQIFDIGVLNALNKSFPVGVQCLETFFKFFMSYRYVFAKYNDDWDGVVNNLMDYVTNKNHQNEIRPFEKIFGEVVVSNRYDLKFLGPFLQVAKGDSVAVQLLHGYFDNIYRWNAHIEIQYLLKSLLEFPKVNDVLIEDVNREFIINHWPYKCDELIASVLLKSEKYSLELLKANLQGSDAMVKTITIGVMGHMHKNAVPLLIGALKNSTTRRSAIAALQNIGSEASEALPYLKDYANDNELHDFVEQTMKKISSN